MNEDKLYQEKFLIEEELVQIKHYIEEKNIDETYNKEQIEYKYNEIIKETE